MKKKLLALMLVMAMVLGMSMTTFAADSYTDQATVTLTKDYTLTNNGTTNPAETFNFVIGDGTVDETTSTYYHNAGEGVTSNVPSFSQDTYTINFPTYTATKDADKVTKTVDITLPTYNEVGVFTYPITETSGTTAGVTYDNGADYILKVTVIRDNGVLKRIAYIHKGTEKSPTFDNTYDAGNLTVGKTVTGLFGDTTKFFEIKVKLNSEANKTYADTYTVTVDSEYQTNPTAIAMGTETSFYLKDGETITINNLPYGVTYSVVEANYSDYTATYAGSDVVEGTLTNAEIDAASENVQITNNKGGTVDTGIFFNNMPYVIAIAVIAIAGLLLIRRRRYTAM